MLCAKGGHHFVGYSSNSLFRRIAYRHLQFLLSGVFRSQYRLHRFYLIKCSLSSTPWNTLSRFVFTVYVKVLPCRCACFEIFCKATIEFIATHVFGKFCPMSFRLPVRRTLSGFVTKCQQVQIFREIYQPGFLWKVSFVKPMSFPVGLIQIFR